MDLDEKVSRGVEWYKQLPEHRQRKAFEELLEHAIMSEWVNVRDQEDVEEILDEYRRDGKVIDADVIRDLQAPYFDTCGEPIDSFTGE